MSEKNCNSCLCQICEKAKDCDNCLMCIGTVNQKPIGLCQDFKGKNSAKGKRVECGILDEYREHDANLINEIILPLLKIDKQKNKEESQD